MGRVVLGRSSFKFVWTAEDEDDCFQNRTGRGPVCKNENENENLSGNDEFAVNEF